MHLLETEIGNLDRNRKVLGMIEGIVNVFLGKAKLTDSWH